MTTLRDMFADHSVQIRFHGEHWTVSLARPSGGSAWNLDCATLDDAIEVARSFAWVLQDDTPIDDAQLTTHRIEVRRLLQEARDRMTASEEIGGGYDGSLREWFSRQMEGE